MKNQGHHYRRQAAPAPAPAPAPDVEDDRLGGVRENRREVVGVLLVPAQTHERRQVVRLVDDGRVLQRAEVEHSHAAIGSHRREDVLRPVCRCSAMQRSAIRYKEEKRGETQKRKNTPIRANERP